MAVSDLHRDLRVAVVGAGPGGICAVVKLREAGFDDVVVLERDDGVGGTWRRNTYPGAACDVQSALYSFSFAPKYDWSRPYAPQPEILAYLEDVAARHDVLRHCRFGAEVVRAAWDEREPRWRLELADGDVVEADAVISALGMFNEPVVPDVEGLGSFAGTAFHSSRWPRDLDVAGRRVAVIGSAASAVQIVPCIVETAEQVHLFQRTANWVLPKPDTPYTAEQLSAFRADPRPVQRMREVIHRMMDEGMTFSDPNVIAEREAAGRDAIAVVEDPVVRAKLLPTHPFGCKRPLLSNDFYASFNRANLELVTDPIARVTPHGVVTADGRERSVDTIVFATGFAATRFLSAIDVVGRDGRRIDDAWRDGAVAHLGVMTSGFPNLFMLYGPNTNNGSILTMIEHQCAHVAAHLRRLVDDDLAWVDVRAEAMARYNDEVQRAIDGVEVWQAGCPGYYRTPAGRVVTQWPFSMTEYARRTAAVDPHDYEAAPRRP